MEQYLLFRVWLLSLNLMPGRFSSVVFMSHFSFTLLNTFVGIDIGVVYSL